MYLIVGLGNPGAKYQGTRHNMGFDTIDRLVDEYHTAVGGGSFLSSLFGSRSGGKGKRGSAGSDGAGNSARKGTSTGFEMTERVNRLMTGGKFHALSDQVMIGNEKVLLMKPLTYMNLSGTAVQEAVHFYKIDPKTELIVISDDVDLDPGRLRIRKKGSAGGQNGLKHIISCLGTDEFIRIRVGTGAKPEGWQMADWVLSHPSAEDRNAIDEALDRAAKAAAAIVTDGVDYAMNHYNG